MCSTALPLDYSTVQFQNLKKLAAEAGVQLHPRRNSPSGNEGGVTLRETEAAPPVRPQRDCLTEFWEPASEARNVRLVWDGRLMTRSSLGHTLILQSHPGDEIACAGLLQHCRNPVVVFATDGMTETESSCPTNRRRETLRYLRRQEATTALVLAGVRQVEFLSDYRNKLRDLHLHRAVPNLFNVMCQMIARYHPETVLVPAYEGGHPDHDVCSFVGALIRKRLNMSVWEMPLYHKADTGELVSQRFRKMNGNEFIYLLNPQELGRRAAMMACYTSRRDFADLSADDTECYRPQDEYDYSRPPQSGTVHYANWRCPVSPSELCQQLAQYAHGVKVPLEVLGSQRPGRLEISSGSR